MASSSSTSSSGGGESLGSRLRKAREETAEKLRVASAKARVNAAASLSAAKKTGAEFAKKLEEPTTGAARRLLESVLADWVEGGAEEEEDDKVRVSLRKGELLMRDVRLKSRSFSSLGLAGGTIGEVRVVVPWTRLGTAPVKVWVRDAKVSLSDATGDAGPASTRQLLDLVDELRANEKQSGGSKKRSGRFARRLAFRALSRVEIEAEALAVDYCGVTVRVERLTGAWDERGVDGLESRGLDVAGVFHAPRIVADATEVIVEDAVVNGDHLLEALETVWTTFGAARRRSELNGDERPSRPVDETNARLWWRRAVAAVHRDRHRTLLKWREAVALARLRAEYVGLAAAAGGRGPRVAEIEASTPLRALLAFRDDEEGEDDPPNKQHPPILRFKGLEVRWGRLRTVGFDAVVFDGSALVLANEDKKIRLEFKQPLRLEILRELHVCLDDAEVAALKEAAARLARFPPYTTRPRPFSIIVDSRGPITATLGSIATLRAARIEANTVADLCVRRGDDEIRVPEATLDSRRHVVAPEVIVVAARGARAVLSDVETADGLVVVASRGCLSLDDDDDDQAGVQNPAAAGGKCRVVATRLEASCFLDYVKVATVRVLREDAVVLSGTSLELSYSSGEDDASTIIEVAPTTLRGRAAEVTRLFFAGGDNKSKGTRRRGREKVVVDCAALDLVLEDETPLSDVDLDASPETPPLALTVSALSVVVVDRGAVEVSVGSLRAGGTTVSARLLIEDRETNIRVDEASAYVDDPTLKLAAAVARVVEAISAAVSSSSGVLRVAAPLIKVARGDLRAEVTGLSSTRRPGNEILMEARVALSRKALLLAPTRIRLERGNILRVEGPVNAYASRSDFEALEATAAAFRVLGSGKGFGGYSAQVRGAVRFVLCEGGDPVAMPCVAVAVDDPILDGRPQKTTLTLGVADVGVYDAMTETWHSVLARPVTLNAQLVDFSDLRVCLGKLDLALDARLAAAVSRLRRRRNEDEDKDVESAPARVLVRNACGATLEVGGVCCLEPGAAAVPRDVEVGPERDGAPLAPLRVNNNLAVPVPRRVFSSSTNHRRDSSVEVGGGLAAEYDVSRGGGGGVAITLRSARRVSTRCREPLECRIDGRESREFRAPFDVPPTVSPTARLSVARGDGPFVDCCAVGDIGKGRAGRGAGLCWFHATEGASGACVVCPEQRLANRLCRRIRVATANRWPRSRDDYAAVYDLAPSETCDLSSSSRFWCLRVDGYDRQSDWVDVVSVLLPDARPGAAQDEASAPRFSVSDTLVAELARAAESSSSPDERRAGVVDLELRCALVCVDRDTSLGLDFLGRTEALNAAAVSSRPDDLPRAKMLDLAPYASLVVEATRLRERREPRPPRSTPFVPLSDGGRVALVPKMGSLVEIGYYEKFVGRQRHLVFVPRIAISHRAASAAQFDLVARQAGDHEQQHQQILARARHAGPIAPFYWARARAPFAIQLAFLAGRDEKLLNWTDPIPARALETTSTTTTLFLEGASFFLGKGAKIRVDRNSDRATIEVVACDAPPRKPKPNSFRLSLRAQVESLRAKFAGLDLDVPRGATLDLATSPESSKCSLDLKALRLADAVRRAVAFATSRGDSSSLRATFRVKTPDDAHRGTLSGAVDLGNAALSLSEAAVWRLVDAARNVRDACDWEGETDDPKTYDVDVVSLSAFSLSPATLLPDAAARRQLSKSLDPDATLSKIAIGCLAAFPKLSIENAVLDFDRCELRRVSALAIPELAARVADAYAAQLKHRWWSLASSLSLASVPSPPSSSSSDSDAYAVFVRARGPLGLVIAWREVDGAPAVADRKPPASRDLDLALRDVSVGDTLLSINGVPAAAHAAEDLVKAMLNRPLNLRFSKRKPRLVELLVPKTEPSLGFTVERARGHLVVTDVRTPSVLSRANVNPGARLLALNGIDLQHTQLDDLTHLCRRLSNTDRHLLLDLSSID